MFMLIGQKHLFKFEGCIGHSGKITCPQNPANKAEKQATQGRARAHHKMLNGRLKNRGILSQFFHHHIYGLRHRNVFRAYGSGGDTAHHGGATLRGGI